MKLQQATRAPVLIGFGMILLAVLVRWVNPTFFERVELLTYDIRVKNALRSTTANSTNLGFVYIDEETISKVATNYFGYRFGLYWPRQVYGRILRELADQGARLVAFDVIFAGLRDDVPIVMQDDSTMDSDVYFALQMARAGNVLLAYSDLRPPDLFLTNALATADISTEKDADGVLRHARAFRDYRYWHKAFLDVEADPGYGVDLNKAKINKKQILLPRDVPGEKPIPIPLDAQGRFNLADFYGDKLPPGMERTALPFTDVRVWHMGVALAAKALGLDLNKAEIDLSHGKITLRSTNGLSRTIPVDSEGRFLIDWSMPPEHRLLAKEPAHKLLWLNWRKAKGFTNQVDSFWRDKIVMVGSSALANDLTDRGATPLKKDTVLVSKHWNIANSILLGRFVRPLPISGDMLLIIGLGIAAGLISWKFQRTQLAVLAVILMCVAYVVLSQYVYNAQRLWIPVVLPVMGAVFTHMGLLAWRVVFEQAERRKIRSVFSKMLSPKIVNELLAAKSLSLGGAKVEVTVFFADVRGFTELTVKAQERVAEYVRERKLEGTAAEACFDEQARETLNTVNTYLGLIADVIKSNDGTWDKFIGDCVMAFWGAPTPNPRHAVACVTAAIQAQRSVYELNQRREQENKAREMENIARAEKGLPLLAALPVLSLGTGINTGPVVAGLMGSASAEMSYTVFGREVNLASRLEGASGHGRIFISEASYQHLRRDAPAIASTCVALTPVRLKGFSAPVPVYEVPWKMPEAAAPDRRTVLVPAQSRTPAPSGK